MQIIPAIDLYNGQCVRLDQGKFDNVTVYDLDPIQCAQGYVSEGATAIHVVDLSGAKQGIETQLDTVISIKQSANVIVQTGGGLRSVAAIEQVLSSAIDRVVIGSLAVLEPETVNAVISKYGVERVVLALDVTIVGEPLLAIKGWQQQTSYPLYSLMHEYSQFEGLSILCTDISRDGMMMGPNLELYRDCLLRFPQFQWQASGGVSQLNDLGELSKLGVSAVIIGKALYEKVFTVQEAIAMVATC